ncbi:MAG: hypothetical protein M1541_15505, partial [Acidobacteria bacterium]|nr:hypothetical protein [Acidobacteriota bacterium]
VGPQKAAQVLTRNDVALVFEQGLQDQERLAGNADSNTRFTQLVAIRLKFECSKPNDNPVFARTLHIPSSYEVKTDDTSQAHKGYERTGS